MRLILAAILYTAIAITANAETINLQGLRVGDMRKLQFSPMPKEIPFVEFLTPDGIEITMDAYKGKIVVLNFWATWCAPCRKEMPELSALQAELGGIDFEVVTIATGRNEPAEMADFFKNIGVTNLPLYRDPKQVFARKMDVLGLPATIVINRDGAEIARLRGDANWHSQSALAIMRALIAAP